jgi:hypothetical protein
MAKKIVNIGTTPGDGTGDTIRDSFIKVNDNMDELFGDVGIKQFEKERKYIASRDVRNGRSLFNIEMPIVTHNDNDYYEKFVGGELLVTVERNDENGDQYCFTEKYLFSSNNNADNKREGDDLPIGINGSMNSAGITGEFVPMTYPFDSSKIGSVGSNTLYDTLELGYRQTDEGVLILSCSVNILDEGYNRGNNWSVGDPYKDSKINCQMNYSVKVDEGIVLRVIIT